MQNPVNAQLRTPPVSSVPRLAGGMPPLPRGLPPLRGNVPSTSENGSVPTVKVSQMPPLLGMKYYQEAQQRLAGRIPPKYYQEAQQVLKELEQPEELLIADEKKLELLERASKLHKRSRKYKQSDPAETWASRWIASSIAYLFPENSREEWLGDLYEINREMLHKGYPCWWINLINVLRTVVLVISALQIKISDLLTFKISSTK
jgi:hypothetical protein